MKFSDEFLDDILIACVEGGSTHWLACQKKELINKEFYILTGPLDRENMEKFDRAQFMLGFDPDQVCIDRQTIERGCNRALTPGVLTEFGGGLIQSILEQDSGEIDAEGADLILQLGFFGDIIYA